MTHPVRTSDALTPFVEARSRTVPASDLHFDDIYLQYRERIVSHLARLVGREDAEDLTQEVFLRVYQALPRLSGEVRLEAWLYRIATNAAYDVLRRRRLVRWIALDELGEQQANDASADPQIAYSSGPSEQVRRALAQMTPMFRHVFLLRVRGWSCPEIGAALGISADAAKMRLHRARQQFCRRYQALQEQEVAA